MWDNGNEDQDRIGMWILAGAAVVVTVIALCATKYAGVW